MELRGREEISCAICNGHDYRPVFRNNCDKFMRILSLPGKSQLVMCRKCGLVYHNPRIHESLIKKVYETHEYPTRSEAVQIERQKDAQSRFEWMADILPEIISVFEIGCAEGFLLKCFRDVKKEVYGIDPSEKYIQMGQRQGLNLKVGFFDKDYSDQKHDLIMACHTFEHIYDPKLFLSEIKKRLNKYLFLECPDVFTPRNNLKYHHFNTTHVYMYSMNTLSRMLSVSGYKVLKVERIRGNVRVLAQLREHQANHSVRDGYYALKSKILLHQLRWAIRVEIPKWTMSRITKIIPG